MYEDRVEGVYESDAGIWMNNLKKYACELLKSMATLDQGRSLDETGN